MAILGRLNVIFFEPRNGTSMPGYASFDMFCVKIRAGALAVGDYRYEKNEKNSRIVVHKFTRLVERRNS